MIKRMIVAVALLFALLLMLLPRTDSTSKKKMVSAAMLMCSNDLRQAVEKQLQRNETIKVQFNNACPDLIAGVEVYEDGEMTLRGAQHGITMMLTPELQQGAIHWHCHGEPAEMITSLCKP